MSRRSQFFQVMRRETEGYVPFEFTFCDSFYREFQRRTGQNDYRAYYGMPVRFEMPRYIGKNDHKPFFRDLKDVTVNQWGIGHRKGSLAHFTQIVSPLVHCQTLEEIREFPFLDALRDYDWDAFADRVRELKAQDLIVYGAMATTIFEVCWQIRGFEPFMMDLLEGSEIADYLMDRMLEIRLVMAEQYAKTGCDCLHLGDDVSTQLDMMMSVPLWRKTLKPRMREIIRHALDIRPDLLIDYHGDGNLQRIIPDLIEVGVDILNPVQPECMDPLAIKRQYGDRLSFRGCLGTQTTLPFGTADEVRRVCREYIREVGRGGGLMLCPTHMVEPEVPYENFEAYLGALEERNGSLA